jgi:hypothetical protein
MRTAGYGLYNHKDTQRTYRQLVAEVVDLYGMPIRYIPKVPSDEEIEPFSTEFGFGEELDIRSNIGLNHIYGEDTTIKYKDLIPMKAILENFEQFEGTYNVFDKLGFSMEPEIHISIEIENFRNLVKRYDYDKLRKPEEGDLILFDLANAKNGKPMIYEITFCNESASYFAFGELMVFELNCKLFKYSDEKLETGDPNIDNLKTDIDNDKLRNEIGDNEEIERQADEIRHWNPKDAFADELTKE